MKTILVTGATGTVGGDVLRGLAGCADVHIRAAVRDKEKSAALAGPNVELVWFDYTKPETLGVASEAPTPPSWSPRSRPTASRNPWSSWQPPKSPE